MDGTNNRNENPQGRSVFEIWKNVGSFVEKKNINVRSAHSCFFLVEKNSFFSTKVFGEMYWKN